MFTLLLQTKYDDENTIVSNNRALGILIEHAKTHIVKTGPV